MLLFYENICQILHAHNICLSCLLHLLAVPLAQIHVHPKELGMTWDFNRGVPSPVFLHLASGRWGVEQEKVSLGDLVHMNIPWLVISQWIQGVVPVSPWLSRGIWKRSRADIHHVLALEIQNVLHSSSEMPDGEVGTSSELPVGCHPLCQGKTRWTRGMRDAGTCREGCSVVGQHL